MNDTSARSAGVAFTALRGTQFPCEGRAHPARTQIQVTLTASEHVEYPMPSSDELDTAEQPLSRCSLVFALADAHPPSLQTRARGDSTSDFSVAHVKQKKTTREQGLTWYTSHGWRGGEVGDEGRRGKGGITTIAPAKGEREPKGSAQTQTCYKEGEKDLGSGRGARRQPSNVSEGCDMASAGLGANGDGGGGGVVLMQCRWCYSTRTGTILTRTVPRW